MNGVHDMGGMQDFGPIRPEKNEPVFHKCWEGRMIAIYLATGAWGKWNIDASRHELELLSPADYLGKSYYQKWLLRMLDYGGQGWLRHVSGIGKRKAREGNPKGDTAPHGCQRGFCYRKGSVKTPRRRSVS